jgi:3-isopropylmalate/(R)-2-methylmalate dehydratase small subunit
MEKFDRLESAAAPLNMANVDTDQIIPARFLWRARSDGYGELLFNDLRANDDGVPKPDFVLNKPLYKDARIIVGDRISAAARRASTPSGRWWTPASAW